MMPTEHSPEHGSVSLRRSAEHGFVSLLRSAEHGFTLVELMIALLIFGMLAAGGVALLSFSVQAQASARERLDDVAAIRRLGAMLTADLAQAVPRTTRSATGDRIPAFQGGTGDAALPLLAFTRAGWSNGAGAPRPTLQKVEYRLVDGRLERVAFAMLDGGEARAAATLFEGVRSVRMRYRGEGDWTAQWATPRPDSLPRAVEMIVEREGEPGIRQAFLVGPGPQ